MARRKTVAVLLAAAPDENTFKGAQIIRRKFSAKVTDEEVKKMAEEFHEYLTKNVESRFYDALHNLMSEHVGD